MVVIKPSHILHRALFCVVFTIFFAFIETHARVIQAEDHPNHYILLIDASGSARPQRNQPKKEAYDRAIAHILPAELYENGFNKKIPVYDEQRDYLTLLNFGVVTGTSSQAYSLLRRVNFSTEIIHPILIWKQNVRQNDLKPLLLPKHTYEYTFMAWTKELALSVSKQSSVNIKANRTFLIIVHDGLFNENASPRKELDWISTLSNPSFEETETLVESINKNYQLTNGSGKKDRLERIQIPEHAPFIFIDIFQVLSTAQAEWEERITDLDAFDEISLNSKHWFSNNAEGLLTISLKKDFLDSLGLPQGARATLRLSYDNEQIASDLSVGSLMEMPVKFKGEFPCEKKLCSVNLEIPLTQTDANLGTRAIKMAKQQNIQAPLPFRCMWMAQAWKWISRGLLILAIGALGYFLYYRVYTTHIDVELPGLIVPIRLKRIGKITAGTPVSPKGGLEAFSLQLPSRWLQRFLYRGATLEIITNSDWNAIWIRDSERSSIIELPLVRKRLMASWEKPPQVPTELTLNFKQGKQCGQIFLSYPKAIPSK